MFHLQKKHTASFHQHHHMSFFLHNEDPWKWNINKTLQTLSKVLQSHKLCTCGTENCGICQINHPSKLSIPSVFSRRFSKILLLACTSYQAVAIVTMVICLNYERQVKNTRTVNMFRLHGSG